MRKLKKRVKVPQRSYPRSLPCRHIPSVHLTTNGKLVVICNPRIHSKVAFIDIDPTVWCRRCGWVKVTDSDYDYYRGFDGSQAPNGSNPKD